MGDWHDCAIRLNDINGGGRDDADADDGDGGGDGGDGGGNDGDGGGDHSQTCLRRHKYIHVHISLGIAMGSLRIHTVYT